MAPAKKTTARTAAAAKRPATVKKTGAARSATAGARTAGKASRTGRTSSAAAGEVLSRRALNRATLARQMLLRREKVKPRAAVERLVALQAQLARPPFLALWSRLDGFRRDDLVTAIEQRDLVRATMMRATIHLLARQDFLALRPAIQPVLTGAWQTILKDRAHAIDVDRLLAASRAHFDATPGTLDALRKHLIAGPFPTLDERAMGYIVKMQLPLVQLPEPGERWAYPSAASFAVADTWLGEALALAQEASAHALALRYLAAFGPASTADFQSWTGLKGMAAVMEDLRPQLRTFRDERGRELFDLPKAPRPSGEEEAPVRFLPEFDNVLLGYAERARIIDEAHKPALLTKNLFVPATFLVDGFIAGLWTVEMKKGIARLIAKPFGALAKAVRTALTDEGGALLQFIEPEAKSHVVDFEKRE